MNKKILYGLVMPLLALTLVTAGILVYYALIGITLNIHQQIDVNGEVPYEYTTTLDCDSGKRCIGDSIIISNNGDSDKTVTTSIFGCGDETDISYIGKLELTKKDTTTWAVIGDPIEITYTIVGDTFEVSGVPEGYTLIYYKDNEANANDEERLTVLGEIGSVTENLPHSNDWNIGELANYCDFANGYDDYEHCKGAKLWAVPDGNIVGGSLVWSNPENFYFETDLVYYFANANGEITIPSDSFITVYPAFDVEDLAFGTCEATITIN